MSDWNAAFLSREQLESIGFASLGRDVLVHPTCVIVGAANIHIGDHSRIDPFTSLLAPKSEIMIGRYVHIAGDVLLSGASGIRIGNYAGVSHGTKLLSRSDDFSGDHMTGPQVPEAFVVPLGGPIELGEHVVIGACSVVLPAVTIGTGSVVGSLSLVKATLDEWGIYAGVPATLLRKRSRGLLADEKQLEVQIAEEARTDPPLDP